MNVAYNGTFPAGWSLPSARITAISADVVDTVSWTPDPLPANVTWHLYNIVTGIGIQIDGVPSGWLGVNITGLTPGKPADQAGVKVNDRLVEVDGKDITALPLGQVFALVRGPANTPVTLGIKRGSETSITRIKVVRAEILSP